MKSKVPEIPAHILTAVNALLAPYGVSLSEMMQKTGDASKYMTARQAANYCGLSPKTIRDKVLAGEFRSIKIGNTDKSRVLVDRADFDRWLESFDTGAV